MDIKVLQEMKTSAEAEINEIENWLQRDGNLAPASVRFAIYRGIESVKGRVDWLDSRITKELMKWPVT